MRLNPDFRIVIGMDKLGKGDMDHARLNLVLMHICQHRESPQH